jgi:hypothetical protein
MAFVGFRGFDDLSGTVLAGHHQPLRVWVLCLYFVGLNLSNRQIALELGLSGSDVQLMTEQLAAGPAQALQSHIAIALLVARCQSVCRPKSETALPPYSNGPLEVVPLHRGRGDVLW